MTENPSRTPPSGATRAVSIRQAADSYGLDPATIRQAIDKLDLPAKKVGRKILIRTTDLEGWFDSLPDAREPEAS